MDTIDCSLELAEKYLADIGVKLTKKRKLVFTALLHSQKALSAYELTDYCKSEFDQIIPAVSVYRILDFLQEIHLVHKLSLANKYVACAHISCHCEHKVPQFLICSQCQKVEEVMVSRSSVAELHQNANKHGFQLLSNQLEMNCVCQECVPQRPS